MVDLRNGINTHACQPIRPVFNRYLEVTHLEDSRFRRYLRLWQIRREFLKTGYVKVPHKLYFLA